MLVSKSESALAKDVSNSEGLCLDGLLGAILLRAAMVWDWTPAKKKKEGVLSFPFFLSLRVVGLRDGGGGDGGEVDIECVRSVWLFFSGRVRGSLRAWFDRV